MAALAGRRRRRHRTTAPILCSSIQPDDLDDSSQLAVNLNQGVALREDQGFVHGKMLVINKFIVTNRCYIVDLAAKGSVAIFLLLSA
ncbi:hypothetical protein JHK85_001785 [Glycine max]|nr:hypothetical protein JHK85_001785 [Glycine max]